jgi:hypothetical protein
MLQLHEPQSFFYIERYIGSLSVLGGSDRLIVCGAAVFLLLLGLPLRRLSAALMLGSVAWVAAGIWAMQAHTHFVLWTSLAGGIAALLAALTPLFGHAFVSATLIGLLVRGVGDYIDIAYAEEALFGGAVLGFVFGLLAWESLPAFFSSMVGAFIVAFCIPLPSLGPTEGLALHIGFSVVFMIAGLFAQFRIGELTWPRVRESFRARA